MGLIWLFFENNSYLIIYNKRADLATAGFGKTTMGVQPFIYKEKRHPGRWRWTVTYFKMVGRRASEDDPI